MICSFLLFFTYKMKESSKALPVCNCREDLACPVPLSKNQCNFTIRTISFSLHQCKICGGISGCPKSAFQKFIYTSSNDERELVMGEFYKHMQTPL
ncbi:hypothetical protein D0S45_15185 [Marinifilum sp. JC120]|nr:hypothetical protein D0S45_15185 [Marinifilum sp. JC120]